MKTVIDLFSGIGGFSIAARRAGFEVVAHCEIDQFPKAVLTHRFFNTPIFLEQKTHSPTLTSHCGTGGGNLPLVINPDAVCIAENIIGRKDHNGGNGVGAQQGVSYTLNTVGVHGVAAGFGVRRLTPRECERLQCFTDDWTLVPYRGKPAESCPDGPRYKACGNAVNVNVAQWVMERLARYA